MRNRSRRLVALGIILVLALTAGACSDSDDDSDDAAAAGADAPKGTPIKIGWIGTVTSANATGPSPGKDGMDAWVKWTNAHGGVSGHPIEVVYEDDKADPAVGIAAAKNLVENEHVVAIVGSSAGSTQQSWAPYVLQKRMPVVGGSLIDALWFTNPMFYPVGGSVIADTWGMMKSAEVAGYDRVGIVLCTEVAACASAQALFKGNAEKVGIEVVFNALASGTATNYTAECIAAKNAGAQAVAAFVQATTFARDCSRQGFKPAYINADLGPTLAIIKQTPEYDNIIGSSEIWPCLDESLPASKDLYAALEQYHDNWVSGGGDHDNFSNPICIAWGSGTAFAKAIANSGVTADATVTSEDVIKGLAMFKNEELGGMAPGVTYGDGTAPSPEQKCTFLYTWKNQKFKPTLAANGKLYSCYT